MKIQRRSFIFDHPAPRTRAGTRERLGNVVCIRTEIEGCKYFRAPEALGYDSIYKFVYAYGMGI